MRGGGLLLIASLAFIAGCGSGGYGEYQGSDKTVETIWVRDVEFVRPVEGEQADVLKAELSRLFAQDPEVMRAYFAFARGRPEDGEMPTIVVIAKPDTSLTRIIDSIREPVRKFGTCDIVLFPEKDEGDVASSAMPFYRRGLPNG